MQKSEDSVDAKKKTGVDIWGLLVFFQPPAYPSVLLSADFLSSHKGRSALFVTVVTLQVFATPLSNGTNLPSLPFGPEFEDVYLEPKKCMGCCSVALIVFSCNFLLTKSVTPRPNLCKLTASPNNWFSQASRVIPGNCAKL